MTLSKAADKVIDLARKVRDYYARELPKRHRNYPLVGLDEESAPPPREEKELTDFLLVLPDELFYQLMLIAHLGRGDIAADDLAEHYETLKGAFGDREETVAQMMTFKAVLADELSDGLEELRKRKLSVDNLPLKRAKVRRR